MPIRGVSANWQQPGRDFPAASIECQRGGTQCAIAGYGTIPLPQAGRGTILQTAVTMGLNEGLPMIFGSLLRRIRRSGRGSAAPRTRTPCSVEPLEGRLFLDADPTAAPRVDSIIADNRGQVVVQTDLPLTQSTVTSQTVQILVANKRVSAQVQYVSESHVIVITASRLAANTEYIVKLDASRIQGTNGKRLDGEFTGASTPSGNGTEGGNYRARIAPPPAANRIARFTTTLGIIDVRLFSTQTPGTVKNFLLYANAGVWDGSFFHRKALHQVVQGGGYGVDTAGNRITVLPTAKAIRNESHPGQPGNIRGTIAMAKLDGKPNSATNQWFFNLADNRGTTANPGFDTVNGGYTVFGQITGDNGLAVLDAIDAKGVANVGGGSLSEVPVMDVSQVIAHHSVNPSVDLIFVDRVAIVCAVRAAPVAASSATAVPSR
jgi:cyclophilin family peptidyl-prolyl cis-trans isomerase